MSSRKFSRRELLTGMITGAVVGGAGCAAADPKKECDGRMNEDTDANDYLVASVTGGQEAVTVNLWDEAPRSFTGEVYDEKGELRGEASIGSGSKSIRIPLSIPPEEDDPTYVLFRLRDRDDIIVEEHSIKVTCSE